MQVERVDFVSIPTRDAGRAIAFYRDVIGLPASTRTESEVETPNVTLSFWEPESQGERFVPNESGVALRVADVREAVEEVRAAGGDVIGIDDTGVCHMLRAVPRRDESVIARSRLLIGRRRTMCR